MKQLSANQSIWLRALVSGPKNEIEWRIATGWRDTQSARGQAAVIIGELRTKGLIEPVPGGIHPKFRITEKGVEEIRREGRK